MKIKRNPLLITVDLVDLVNIEIKHDGIGEGEGTLGPVIHVGQVSGTWGQGLAAGGGL